MSPPPHQTKKVALTITTRGLGFATCNLCYIAAAAAGLEPPLYAMYRLALGLAEAKLRRCPAYLGELEPLVYFSRKLHPYSVLKMMRTTTIAIVPTPIKRIIDAIDVITHNGTEYFPVMAAQVKDAAGRPVPRPESLLLSNLRETVVALSTADTPVEYRAAFKENCPIPGAIWDNDLLLNADEIMPEEYDISEIEDLVDDLWSVSMFLISMREKYPLMVDGPLLEPGKSVSKAALISNSMCDLHAKPRLVGESLVGYCKRCNPRGYLGPYYELEKVSDADILDGQVALLGELPRRHAMKCALDGVEAPVLEIYGLRQGKFDPTGKYVGGNYTASLMVTNEALLSPAAAQCPTPRDEPVVAPQRPEYGYGRGRGPRNRRRNYQ